MTSKRQRQLWRSLDLGGLRRPWALRWTLASTMGEAGLKRMAGRVRGSVVLVLHHLSLALRPPRVKHEPSVAGRSAPKWTEVWASPPAHLPFPPLSRPTSAVQLCLVFSLRLVLLLVQHRPCRLHTTTTARSRARLLLATQTPAFASHRRLLQPMQLVSSIPRSYGGEEDAKRSG